MDCGPCEWDPIKTVCNSKWITIGALREVLISSHGRPSLLQTDRFGYNLAHIAQACATQGPTNRTANHAVTQNYTKLAESYRQQSSLY